MAQNPALPTFSAIYAFGDSLSDAGNLSITTRVVGPLTPVAPPYFQQNYGLLSGNMFSNGPTWVQDLSTSLGLGTLAPSLTGGTDFAYGGAETGSTPQNANETAIQAISLPTQLVTFQTSVSKPSADALYTVSIGSNDLLDILANPSLSAQQQTTDLNASVANEITFVNELISGGAKNLLILGIPDLGKTPEVMTGAANGSNTPSAALDTEASQLSSAYNAALLSQLATLPGAGSVNISMIDTYQLIDSAVANPAAYGLTNVTTPVWSGTYSDPNSGTLVSTDVATQDQYLFWDHLHPTETGHEAINSLAQGQLIAKSGALIVQNTSTGQPVASMPAPYAGPVPGLQDEYIAVTSDNLNITATTPNWFIHGGSGNDGISVSSGTNVVDGGGGSNFLTGGTGTDTFFVDTRGAAADIWSTLVNFHTGDSATLWGVSSSDFAINWVDGQGATGYAGLTLHATEAGKPTASLTLTGYATGDLGDGRLSVTFGTDTASGSAYMSILSKAV
jgi:phospholipase/lecithinase/hemolysin